MFYSRMSTSETNTTQNYLLIDYLTLNANLVYSLYLIIEPANDTGLLHYEKNKGGASVQGHHNNALFVNTNGKPA